MSWVKAHGSTEWLPADEFPCPVCGKTGPEHTEGDWRRCYPEDYPTGPARDVLAYIDECEREATRPHISEHTLQLAATTDRYWTVTRRPDGWTTEIWTFDTAEEAEALVNDLTGATP